MIYTVYGYINTTQSQTSWIILDWNKIKQSLPTLPNLENRGTKTKEKKEGKKFYHNIPSCQLYNVEQMNLSSSYIESYWFSVGLCKQIYIPICCCWMVVGFWFRFRWKTKKKPKNAFLLPCTAFKNLSYCDCFPCYSLSNRQEYEWIKCVMTWQKHELFFSSRRKE